MSTPSTTLDSFAPKKQVFFYLLDVGWKLDQICCQKDEDQVTLNWIKESRRTDLTGIPNNPAAYDAPVSNPLPFDFDDTVLLAVHTMDGIRKHLWFCLANQQLFWLIGTVPDRIQTWRHKMLRREKYVSKVPLFMHYSSPNKGTTLFAKALRFRSNEATIADVLNQNTRFGGLKRNWKQILKVQPGLATDAPSLHGLRRITPIAAQMMTSNQRVASVLTNVFRMGEGCFANASVIPETVSVSQISESLSALDLASLSAPYTGIGKLKHAMMDIDNAVFCVSATQMAMQPEMTEKQLINILRRRLTEREQGDVVTFVPSGKWQQSLSSGPTVRPVGGGHWWLLNSPSKTAEPVRFWIHSTDFLDVQSLKRSAFQLAQTLFLVFDKSSPEISKLILNNTQHDVKVPGGFLLPLAISIMACRIASAQKNPPEVTIFLETYSNKSHGLKLNALQLKAVFGSNEWLDMMAAELSRLMKYSVLNMFQSLIKDHECRCFDFIPEKSSIGFGLSTSYVDEKDQPLHSVCKQNSWIHSDYHESFCVLGLHSEMSTHTTHFKDGPIKRVQAYIEGANAISNKQCGHGGFNIYNHIGLSALNKAHTTGILNVTAMLDGIRDEFGLLNESINSMRTCPRNRTEIQVGCIAVQPNELNLKVMIASAVKVVLDSTQHWKIDHVFSFASLNASAMILIMRQSWILASEVNRNIVERQQLLDIASITLKRWRSFLTGRGDGVIGSKHDRKLVHLPHLSESLLTSLDSMLPEEARKFKRFDNFRLFGAQEIVQTFNDAFSTSMNNRIIKNRAESEEELSKHIMKCVGCGHLYFGASNKEALQLHHVESPSCIASDWQRRKTVTCEDWFQAYKNVIELYEKFIDTCSDEQREACESVLKFGSGLLAIGVAGSGKSVVLNEIAKVLNSIYFKDGEILICAATGLLAQYFNDSATTVHSAIGAYPDFGTEANWNLSVQQWSDLIQRHGKVNSTLKVFINTEVYAQSSNMLQALFEMRSDYEGLKFICLMDGDPLQPMHEDDSEDHRQLCATQDHILLKHSVIHHLLPEVRVVMFETPKRQLDEAVHDLSNAVRQGQAKRCHVQKMRSNPYLPGTTVVDIIICSLRKDMFRHNKTNLDCLPGQVQTFCAKRTALTKTQDLASYALRLKVNAPVLFCQALKLKVNNKIQQRQIANGTRGTILKFDGEIILVAIFGTTLVVEVERVKIFKRRLEFEQFPLDLGWATTIKRAGGMTFSTIAVDFGFDWCQTDAQLCTNAKQSWRMSQAYGAITRSRLLAYFVNADSFRDSVMLVFLNNQNMQALDFLTALINQIKMPFFTSEQEKSYFSLATQATQPPAKKRKHCVSYELLEMQAMTTLSDSKTSMVYVSKYPNVLANQQAGYYCKGTLTSTESIKVFVKKTHQGHDQQNEIRALEALSGIHGIPTVLGKIVLEKETRLVFEDTNAVPFRLAALNSEQTTDLLRIKNAMKSRGWSLHIRNENIWLNAGNNTVMLFNFEAASYEECSSLDTAPVIPELDVDTRDILLTSDEHAAPAPSKHSICILPENIFQDPKQYQQMLAKWKITPQQHRLQRVSKLWEKTHDEVYVEHGPRVSWESGLKGHRPASRGYGIATADICLLMSQVHQKYSKSQSHGPPISSQIFVDIGSGISNIVLQMAAFQPDFRSCCGIEMETPRAAFAKQACKVFTDKAANEGIPFCEVQAEEGDCFSSMSNQRVLRSAGLVWINNEIFEQKDNLKLLSHLQLLVPVGCIIMSFVELITTKRGCATQPQKDEPIDFTVHPPIELKNSCSWLDPKKIKKVYVIQRTSFFKLIDE